MSKVYLILTLIVEEDPSLHSRRKLIVVAVVLAKVCSETEFCEVEQDYMILNDFIFEKENVETKRKFIDGLSVSVCHTEVYVFND